jgi:hypothetical protein
MSEFTTRRSRDAWFVIRGYKYQVDLTILRWLSIADDQVLILEFGEDIDIVHNAILSHSDEVDRELEQVKHLDRPITLRSPECRVALANAIQHFVDNPSQQLLFRFCTNSPFTTERPAVFQDRQSGIDIWERIRKNVVAEPDRQARLCSLLAFLRELEKPSDGIDDETWDGFMQFIIQASVENLASVIKRFEWSTQQLSADDISAEILRLLIQRNVNEATVLYPRLFLHVIQVLSRSGEKRLDAASLVYVLRLPALSEADVKLLNFLTLEVILQSQRLEEVELAIRQHETQISEIRQQLLVAEFGYGTSVHLATAIADISTTLPPLVRPLAKRSRVVSALQRTVSSNDWLAIYGSIGCGKTQLASLIGDNTLGPIVYISFRDLNSSEANFLLYHLFMQLCHNTLNGSGVNSGLTALNHDTVIILDDVPRLIPGDQLSKRLIQIADRVHTRTQRLVTLSHHPIPRDVMHLLHNAEFTEIPAPRFDDDDVIDLFEQHGAPREAITPEIASSFLQSTLGNPTLLAAIARTIESKGWHYIKEQQAQSAASASAGELIEQAMFRLLSTVASEDSRELLYRLCVVIGAFGSDEVNATAAVDPRIVRPDEAYQSIMGLWIERQSDTFSVVCPLIAQFGSRELEPAVERNVANALAKLVFKSGSVSPIDFAKGLHYFRRARNGVSLGMYMLRGLESVCDLPVAWRKLAYATTVVEGLLDDCPTVLGLLIKARQLELAHSLGVPIVGHVSEANQLMGKTKENERWAVLSYASQAVQIVATSDLDEALRLAGIALDYFDEVIEFRNAIVGVVPDDGDMLDKQFKRSIPWYIVSNLRSVDDFLKWFTFITTQPKELVKDIFASDLARDGFKLALDRLWMMQHEMPESERQFDAILAAYNAVIAFCQEHSLRLFHALAVRSQIVVHAEYLNDLGKAIEIADAFLLQGDNTNEIAFLIDEVIGRQYLYAKHTGKAIEKLTAACKLDTGTFDGLRCRAFIELSRAIGDNNCEKAFLLAESAVAIAKRSPNSVSELDMVSSLGEAAIAAGFAGKYGVSFDRIEDAFSRMSLEFEDTIDWKMRFVFLGNALGYLASMAFNGKPPASDYTVPPRGHLITYNEAASRWYDEVHYKKFDLAPTLLSMFANAVGKHDRAIYWAEKGIDDARSKGVLVSIYSLGEALIPNFLVQDKIDQALDCAFESSIALTASMVAHRCATPDIRESQNAVGLLGSRPSDDWSQAEQLYLFTGVIPSILFYSVNDKEKNQKLQHLATHCSNKAKDASNSIQFTAVSNAITMFLANSSSADLHLCALRENERNNSAGRCAYYLLSSFVEGADLKVSIVQHALIMQECSLKILGDSVLWKFITDQLIIFWRQTFERGRFRFSIPAVIQDELCALDKIEPKKRVKHLIRTIVQGLSVRLPPQLKSTSEWLRN